VKKCLRSKGTSHVKAADMKEENLRLVVDNLLDKFTDTMS